MSDLNTCGRVGLHTRTLHRPDREQPRVPRVRNHESASKTLIRYCGRRFSAAC
jgi:protein tyrosine phosphatase (PTP) superfamily phosphohydrolase (DUF442 family)